MQVRTVLVDPLEADELVHHRLTGKDQLSHTCISVRTASTRLRTRGSRKRSPGAKGAQWGPYHGWSYDSIALPLDDPSAALPMHVLRERHPEVLVRCDGSLWIPDPNQVWFTFTGRGAGRVRRGSAGADTKCREKADVYAVLKAKVRELLQRRAGAG